MSYMSRRTPRFKKITIAIMAALLMHPAAAGFGLGNPLAYAEDSETEPSGGNAGMADVPEQTGAAGTDASMDDAESASVPESSEEGGISPAANEMMASEASAQNDAAETDKPVVISKIFGGGSQNNDALYKYDFIELYNPADNDVNLSGWSVQYAASTSTKDSASWSVTPLQGTIRAKGYYLVREAGDPSASVPDLPTPDDAGSINMDNKTGKVALVTNSTALTVPNPASSAVSSVSDFVGYGDALSYSGTGAATAPSAQKTLVRKAEDPNLGTGVPSLIGTEAELYGNGWNTGDNKTDFDIAKLGSFAPHNAQYITPLSARADAEKHTIRMVSLRDVSPSDNQFAVTVATGSLKTGELDPQDYEVSGLPAGLTVTGAKAQLHQVTFTIGGRANADVTSAAELGVVIRKTAVTTGAYDDSRIVKGITLEHFTPKITGDLLSNSLGMTGPTTAGGSFTIRIKSGTVKEGLLTDLDYSVAGLPAGLTAQASGDPASNLVTFTVSGTTAQPVIEPIPLTVVLKASSVVTEGALDSDPMTGMVLDRYKAPVQTGAARRTELTQRLLEGNAYYHDPETKSYKYGASGMAASSAAFYRGAPYLMYQDLGGVIPVPDSWKKLSGVKTWISGDAHLANVGFFDDKSGNIVFDLNDYDGSYIAPFYLDLIRVTSSLYLTRDSEKIDMSDAEIRSLAGDMLDQYMRTLQSLIGNNGKNTEASKLDMSHVNDGFTKTIMTKLGKKTQLDQLLKWTVPTADGKHSTGVLNVAGKPDKYRVPSASERAEVELNWQKYVDTLSPEFVQTKLAEHQDYFKIKDVAVRIYQGLGSIGSQRYNVLIEGATGSSDDDILLDVKQSFKPDMFENAEEAQTTAYDDYPGGDGARVKAAYEKLSLDPEPFLGYFDSGARSFFVHKISLYKGDYEDASGGTFKTKENYADYVGYAAKAFAYAHARSSGSDDTFEKSVIGQVYGNGAWNTFETTLLNLGEDYYRQVTSDYELMKPDMIGGRLIDVASLKGLDVKGVTLSPAFDRDKLNYSAQVYNSVSSVEVTASSLDGKATMTLNGALYSSTIPKSVELRPGANQIDIVVTAQDGVTSKTYMVQIERKQAGGGNGGNNGNNGNEGNNGNNGNEGNNGNNGGGNSGGTGGGSNGSNGGNTSNGGGTGTNGSGTKPPVNLGGAGANTLVIDAGTFEKALSEARQDPSANHQLSFDVTGHESGEMQLQLPFDELRQAAKTMPDLVLMLHAGNVNYRLPVRTVDFESLVQKWGAQSGAGTINIRIQSGSGNAETAMRDQLKTADFMPQSAPVEALLYAADKNGNPSEIRHLNGGYAVMTIPFTASIPAGDLVAVRINKDGTVTVVPAVFKDGNAILHIRDNGTYAVAQAKPRSFVDISKHWAKSEIELLAGKRIVKGISSQAFSPDKAMSRAELTALFAKAFALEEDHSFAGFADVSASDWYAGSVAALSKAGIVSGFPGGSFKPSEAISREQLAVMMVKAADLAGKPLQASAAEQTAGSFKDAGLISGYARDAVQACRIAGIIQGNPDGSFMPQASVTRAQAAIMMKQLLQVIGFINE
ncbi:DUF2252 family protein [Paenibacillus chibensis]|uniref:DUF2252 family protein n=1 Tax=Paenibacillus chibensis TaxID=59846 RepID=UPI000FD8E60E|nr:DUF2252 family protein [Paenibacillus chibensis]MEC0368957.1 DUF2252 family protein [Paenibacillus chibensis]